MSSILTSTVKAVLFDLDDTLFDHRHSSRASLEALRLRYTHFQQSTLDELELVRRDILEEIHLQVLAGSISLHEARITRMQRLFAQYEQPISREIAEQIALENQAVYQSSRQAVQGAISLLEALRPHVKIGIISNNLLQEQLDKLDFCKLAPLIDVLVVSEEVGIAKPDPRIFQVALERLDCSPSQAVMVGDSWDTDIVGATRLGIRAIWLNRYGIPCPATSLATEIASLEQTDRLVSLLLGIKAS